MPLLISRMFSPRKKLSIKIFGVKTYFLQLTLMKIDFFQVCSPPPRDQEKNPFAHSCSFTLKTSYKNDMLGPGGGEAVKMLKINV